MKIVVLGTRGFPGVQGGVETHCENLYPRLAAKGCKVIVFTRAQYVDPSVKEFKGVKFIPLTCPKNKFLEAFVHTLFGVLAARKLKPGVLHIHTVGPALFVPLAMMLGMRVVMTHQGPDYERAKWGRLAKVVLRLGEAWGCRFADKVICVAEYIAEGVRRKYGRKKEVAVIPNGVVMPVAGKTGTVPVFQQFGVELGKYVLAVGRFVPEKGFVDLIRAFDIVLSSPNSGAPCNGISGWKLVIVGRADHEDKYSRGLKEAAAKNPNIVLAGYLSGVPLQELYSHAGIFVLPSYYEGLPIVLLEAASYGLSCVASDIPANKEVGLPEERFFKAGDIEALAAKIAEYAKKPISEEERRAQIKTITEKYDWDKIADATFKVYSGVVGGSVCQQ